MNLLNESLKTIKKIVLKYSPSNTQVFLFGSTAQGHRQQSSDIDVGFLGSHMNLRGISKPEVKGVFLKPEQKIDICENRQIWQSKVLRDGKIYLIRLIIELRPELSIITVYKTSKLHKYWRLDA